jgi:aryl-alcohol dehydrogenase-like predicted oxidoreductase
LCVGVGIVAYSPLGRGLLSGAILNTSQLDSKDWRLTNPRFTEENMATNINAKSGFFAFAERKGCTPAQLALSWLMGQGNDVFPIPGTKSAERLAENVAAGRLIIY